MRLNVIFMGLFALAACILAGCMKTPPSPASVSAYRDARVPIYSSAVMDPALLRGTWQQVGSFSKTSLPCGHGQVTFGAVQGGVLTLNGQLCLEQGAQKLAGRAQMINMGRLQLQNSAGVLARPWWVLWADADMRTLVVGTPDGTMGLVLNRGPLGADRWQAAQDVLRWNGYDIADLRRF